MQLVHGQPAPVQNRGLAHPDGVLQFRNLRRQLRLLGGVAGLDGRIVLVQRADLPLILQRHARQQPGQYDERRAPGTAPQAAAALFLGIAGGQQVPQRVQRHGGHGGVGVLRAQQCVHADAQRRSQRLQIVQPGQGGILLPLAQRLAADADFFSQCLLAQPLRPARILDILPQCHTLALFPLFSDMILPQNMVKYQQVKLTKQ